MCLFKVLYLLQERTERKACSKIRWLTTSCSIYFYDMFNERVTSLVLWELFYRELWAVFDGREAFSPSIWVKKKDCLS